MARATADHCAKRRGKSSRTSQNTATIQVATPRNFTASICASRKEKNCEGTNALTVSDATIAASSAAAGGR